MNSGKKDDKSATELPNDVKIKTEPGIGTSVRLSSFKPPRDLMLNSNSINKHVPKKVFVPNLNVTRNKNKHLLIVDNKKDRRKPDKQNGRDNKKGNQHNRNSNILKSTGVFSEGIASTSNPNRNRESYSRASSRESTSSITKPVFRKQIKIDKEFEDMKIKEYSSEDEEMDGTVDVKFLPIRLPMDVDNGGFLYRPEEKVLKSKLLIKQEPIIKTEPVDMEIATDPAVKSEIKDFKEENIFQSTKSKLLMLQFPDSLPGRGPDSQDNKKTDEKETEPSMQNTCTFEHLEEGQIGKLLLYSSGKSQLRIGDTYYDLTLGTPTCFRQDVMSISVNQEERTGRMINLGSIQNKIMAIPNWESMLKESGMS